jgi:uncharacterized protein (TIGR00369 family)
VGYTARDPNYEARVRASFAAQKFMATIGAELERILPGEVAVGLPFREDLVQQHGFLHAGVSAALADTACGYAALSLMEPEAAVLSVEFKLNLLEPATGSRFVAVGRVIRAGRTLTVCRAEVFARQAQSEVVVAAMQATMMAIRERSGLRD